MKTLSPLETAMMTASMAMMLAITGCDTLYMTQGPSGFGTVELALTSVGTDGETYRLSGSQLLVQGPIVATDGSDGALQSMGVMADDSASTLSFDLDEAFGHSDHIEARLHAGSYVVSLADGWTLERWNGRSFEPVAALLTSPNPMTISVDVNDTTALIFDFETQDANVEFATGTLEVWLEVSQTKCVPGRMVGRSCGTNLIGKQFQVCDAGWWTDWTSCSEGCNGGFCMFTKAADYEDIAIAMTPAHLDFETYSDGQEVTPETNRVTTGGDLSDEVSFKSFGASSQKLPADSDIDYRGQTLQTIVLDGGWTSGDARIRSSAGSENSPGFDGMEITFVGAAQATDILSALQLVLESNNAGYEVELFSAATHLPVSSFEVLPEHGTHLTFSVDATRPSSMAISRVRITPMVDTFEMLETHQWAIMDLSWSY